MTQFCHPHWSFIHMCAQIHKVREVREYPQTSLINMKEGKWDNFASNYWCYTSRSDQHWPEIIKQTGRKCPLTFATLLPTDKSWGLSWAGTFLLLSLICLCASWRARTEFSRSRQCPERLYLSRNPKENSLWVFIRFYQRPQSQRGSKNRKTLLVTITHNFYHKAFFKVVDQDKNNIRWRSNQYVLAQTKLLSVVRCTNWENVTYRSTLPVANPISVHIAFHV